MPEAFLGGRVVEACWGQAHRDRTSPMGGSNSTAQVLTDPSGEIGSLRARLVSWSVLHNSAQITRMSRLKIL